MSKPDPTPVSDSLLSPERFARFIGIGRRTFQSWRASGKLPRPDLHVGKVIRWKRETIERWLEGQRNGGRP